MGSFFERIIVNVGLVGLIFVAILFITNRRFKRRTIKQDKFLEDEMEANTSRRRDVEEEYFFHPNLAILPVNDKAEGNIAKKQDMVVRLSDKKMVRFPMKLTNTELKKAYGPSNLEIITGYEENYTRYIGALADWALALLETDKTNDKASDRSEHKTLEVDVEANAEANAIRILEYTVELGSEFRKTYTNLADYYRKKGNFDKLDDLMKQVQVSFNDEGIKQSLVKYIMDKKN